MSLWREERSVRRQIQFNFIIPAQLDDVFERSTFAIAIHQRFSHRRRNLKSIENGGFIKGETTDDLFQSEWSGFSDHLFHQVEIHSSSTDFRFFTRLLVR